MDALGLPGAILGCDYSGTVIEVGDDCRKDLKPGDAIFGAVHGAKRTEIKNGAFAEYCMQKSGLCGKIPEGMGFEDAATLGVAINSTGRGMCQTLGIPSPSSPATKPFPVLIYGGGTSHGSIAVQLAKLAGLIVITTTSPENFEFLKSRGADAVLDYHDPDCAKKIREFTHNELRRVFDTVGLPQTAKICADAMAPSAENGELRYTSSIPVQAFPRDDVTNTNYLAYDAVGESYEMFGINFPAVPENYEFAKAFWQVATALVQEGKLIPHPAQVNNGGLAGIPAGLLLLRENRVKARKLVYKVADTPSI